MLESQGVGNLADGQIGGGQLLFRLFNQPVVDVVLGALPGQEFEQGRQVNGREVQRLGNLPDRGQSFFGQIIRSEIVR